MRILIAIVLIALVQFAKFSAAHAQAVDSTSSEFLNSELAQQNYGELQFGIGENWLLDPLRKYSVNPLTVSINTSAVSYPQNAVFINDADGVFLHLSPSFVHPLLGWLKFIASASLYARQLNETEQHRT